MEGDCYAPNNARLLSFRTGGSMTLPDPPEFIQQPPNPSPQFASANVITRGVGV